MSRSHDAGRSPAPGRTAPAAPAANTWRRIAWGLRMASLALAGVVVVAGLALAALWLLLAQLDAHRSDLERTLSRLLGQPMTIGTVEASWDGLSPVLRLHDVRVFPPAPPPVPATAGREVAPVAHLDDAEIVIDPLASVRARTLRSRRVRVSGASLVVRRDTSGAVSLAGIAGSEAPVEAGDEGLADVMRFLLAQTELELRSTQLVWIDARAPATARTLREVQLRLRRLDGPEPGHTVSGSLAPSADENARLVFEGEIRGNLQTEDWQGRLRLEGRRLGLADLAALVASVAAPQATDLPELDGRMGFELEADIGSVGLRHASGRVGVRQARLPLAHGMLALAEVDAQMRVDRVARDWRLTLSPIRVVGQHGGRPAPWPLRRVELALAPETLTLAFDALRVEDAAELAPVVLGPEAQALLTRMRPRGRLEEGQLRWRLDDRRLRFAAGSAIVADLAVTAAGLLPGATGLNGRLALSERGADFELAPHDRAAVVDLPRLYEAPLALRTLHGALRVRLDEDGPSVAFDAVRGISQDGLSASIDGTVRWGRGEPRPYLDLRIGLGAAETAVVRPYLLPHVVPERLAGWLRRSVREGRFLGGEVRLQGPATRGLILQPGSGFTGSVSEAELRYAEGWPAARGVAATVRLDGPALAVDVSAGTVFGSSTDGATLEIADIRRRPRILAVRGRLVGPVGDVLRFVRESPLEARVNARLRGLAASGGAALEGALEIDLEARRAVGYRGTLTLRDSTLTTPLGTELRGVQGQLRFSPEGLQAQDLEARYLEAPVHIDIASSAGAGTRVTGRGTADAGFVTRQLETLGAAGLPGDLFAGQARWSATVELPPPRRPGAAAAGAYTVTVRSDLEQAVINLPGQLAKGPGQIRPLTVEAVFPAPEIRPGITPGVTLVRIAYGKRWRVAAALERGPDGWRLARAGVQAGGAAAALPSEPGVVVEGRLDTLDLDAWQTRLGELAGSSRPVAAGGLRRIDLQLAEVRWLRRPFAMDRVTAERIGPGWRIELRGDDAAGEIRVEGAGPAPGAARTVTVALDRLHLSRSAGGQSGPGPEPQSFPPVTMRIEHLRYGWQDLGALTLRTVPVPGGLQIDDLDLTAAAFRVTGAGDWTRQGGLESSAFELRVAAPDLGALAIALGHADPPIEGGEFELRADLGWPGGPGAFDLARVRGSLHVRALNGRMLELRPGLTGRAFGLFSLTALPRHLRMDFSHVFAKGLAFDRIEGSFDLDGGDAYTNDLHLLGPAARIDLAGRTGLVARDYDQLVTVTPRVSSSLPLAPIWLAEKLLRRQLLDQAFATRYVLTGTWEEPRLDRVEEPPIEPEPDPLL